MSRSHLDPGEEGTVTDAKIRTEGSEPIHISRDGVGGHNVVESDTRHDQSTGLHHGLTMSRRSLTATRTSFLVENPEPMRRRATLELAPGA